MITMSDSGLAWRKATASTANGNCVEVAPFNGGVTLRDSKDPDGPVLYFSRAEFAAFADGIKAGEFNNLTDGARRGHSAPTAGRAHPDGARPH